MRRGLSTEPKRFLPKYFYDQLGSQLFEAICLLPEYYLTRAENQILEQYADEIVASVDGETTLVEMGSGSASKTRLIIEALLRKQQDFFHPVDISASALDSTRAFFCIRIRNSKSKLMRPTISLVWRSLGKQSAGRRWLCFLVQTSATSIR